MIEEALSYQDKKGASLRGFLVYDKSLSSPRPGVLVAPDWSGCNDFARKKAHFLASLGYVAFAIDMYGEGKTATTREAKMALIQPLTSNRPLIRDRITAAFNTLTAQTMVDRTKIGAIGFCFGGLCVLDLARSGAPLKGVVSLHGALNPPENLPNASISAKILALHGYDDPMVPPAQVDAFAKEMTDAKADWQIHMYGLTKHAFTNPEANDPAFGTVYQETANHRAFLTLQNFFAEVFN